jgi:arylsulfatase A-like enzyme
MTRGRVAGSSLLPLAACLLWGRPAAAAGRPYLILVFIDGMGWGDFSSFGNTELTTQRVDRLAGEGSRFDQFHVNSPIGSPSRSAPLASVRP